MIKICNDAVVRRVRHICAGADAKDYKPAAPMIKTNTANDSSLPVIQLFHDRFVCDNIQYRETVEEIAGTGKCDMKQVLQGEKTLDDLIGSLSNEQLAFLTIGRFEEAVNPMSAVGASAVSLAGGAGETTDRLSDLGVGALTMADDPAGLRLSTSYKVVGGKIKPMGNPLEGYMDFLGQEELQMLAQMTLQPTREELDAPLLYQYCTAIPIGTALAQSWSVEVCRDCGDVVGKEMELFGVNYWPAPAMNIQRSPLRGRNFEYYSEDPLLSGLCAAGVTEGIRRHPGCSAVIKHFACNNQETNRYVSNSVVSERALREIFLKTFEVCIKNYSPYGVMSSYNLINGEHTCNSKELLTYALRDEWGFDGIVMTDWYATQDVLAAGGKRENKHGIGSAAGCVKSGNDLTMPGGKTDFEDIMRALTDREYAYYLSRAELQAAAKRILTAVMKLRKHD